MLVGHTPPVVVTEYCCRMGGDRCITWYSIYLLSVYFFVVFLWLLLFLSIQPRLIVHIHTLQVEEEGDRFYPIPSQPIPTHSHSQI